MCYFCSSAPQIKSFGICRNEKQKKVFYKPTALPVVKNQQHPSTK